LIALESNSYPALMEWGLLKEKDDSLIKLYVSKINKKLFLFLLSKSLKHTGLEVKSKLSVLVMMSGNEALNLFINLLNQSIKELEKLKEVL